MSEVDDVEVKEVVVVEEEAAAVVAASGDSDEDGDDDGEKKGRRSRRPRRERDDEDDDAEGGEEKPQVDKEERSRLQLEKRRNGPKGIAMDDDAVAELFERTLKDVRERLNLHNTTHNTPRWLLVQSLTHTSILLLILSLHVSPPSPP